MRRYECTEFEVPAVTEPVMCSLATPPADRLSPDPALVLVWGAVRHGVINSESCYRIVQTFVEAGHRALSFDPPNHGQFENAHGSGIVGMSAAFAAGDDPFAAFVDNGKAVIDHCLEAGLVSADRVFASGRSRGAYCALRLMAADLRVRGTVALAPVTDWRVLVEFADIAERTETAALSLHNFIDALAARPVYVAIGNNDERVSTANCIDFVAQLLAADKAVAEQAGHVEFHLVTEGGHMVTDDWGDAGGRFLLAGLAADA